MQTLTRRTLTLLVSIISCALVLPLTHANALALPLHQRSNVSYPLSAEIVYNFPNGTWLENLAVRSNGQILTTEDTPKPRVYQVDPFGLRRPILLHEFSEASQLLGIVETAPDVFCVASGNFSSTKLESYGEAYIFELDLRHFAPDRPESAQVRRLAVLPEAKALNGLAYLGEDSNLLLVSDFLLGVIWGVNIETGDVSLPINNTYTRSSGFGVNGLKVLGKDLYFTNSQQQTLVRVPVNPRGQTVGNFTVLSNLRIEPDDFALDQVGNFYVTSFTPDRNGIVFIPSQGGPATNVAAVAGATACAFGRTTKDRKVLYVSTSGGDFDYNTGKPVTVSGKIVKIDVGGYVQ